MSLRRTPLSSQAADRRMESLVRRVVGESAWPLQVVHAFVARARHDPNRAPDVVELLERMEAAAFDIEDLVRELAATASDDRSPARC